MSFDPIANGWRKYHKNTINIQDHGFANFETYFAKAMTTSTPHIADVETNGFWEKVDEITKNGCNIIWLVDNDGVCVCVAPTTLGKPHNLSTAQWISYLPDVDAYVYVKANINRGRSEYDEARLHMWLEILPKV